jgi:hypothetical protein
MIHIDRYFAHLYAMLAFPYNKLIRLDKSLLDKCSIFFYGRELKGWVRRPF